MIIERRQSGLFGNRPRASEDNISVNEEIQVKAKCLRVISEDETPSVLCDMDVTSQGQTHQAKVQYKTLKQIQQEQYELNQNTPHLPSIDDDQIEFQELEQEIESFITFLYRSNLMTPELSGQLGLLSTEYLKKLHISRMQRFSRPSAKIGIEKTLKVFIFNDKRFIQLKVPITILYHELLDLVAKHLQLDDFSDLKLFDEDQIRPNDERVYPECQVIHLASQQKVLHLRKYYFYSPQIENQDRLSRMEQVAAQHFHFIFQKYYNLTEQDYQMFMALQKMFNEDETPIDELSMEQYIDRDLFQIDDQQKWIDSINQILENFKEDFSLIINYKLKCLTDSPDFQPDQSPIKESICGKSKLNICFILNKLISQHPLYGTHVFEAEATQETLDNLSQRDERINQTQMSIGVSFRGVHVILMNSHIHLIRYQDCQEVGFSDGMITISSSDGQLQFKSQRGQEFLDLTEHYRK